MKIKLFVLAGLLSMACGAEAESVDEPTNEEATVPSTSEAVDLGETSEALNVPFRYGFMEFNDGGNTPCSFPNTTQPTCDLPADRVIRIHWSGPTTDSRFPGVDFLSAFRSAVSIWKTNISLNNLPWTITETSSGPEQASLGSLGGCLLGKTSFASITARTCLTQGVIGPTPQCVSKVNSCVITLSPANMNACGYNTGDTAFDKFSAQAIFTHELGHCFGLPHSQDGCGNVGSFMNAGLCGQFHSFPTSNMNLDADERAALQSYVP